MSIHPNRDILDLEGNVILTFGHCPVRQLKMILAWAVIHQDELMQNWGWQRIASRSTRSRL